METIERLKTLVNYSITFHRATNGALNAFPVNRSKQILSAWFNANHHHFQKGVNNNPAWWLEVHVTVARVETRRRLFLRSEMRKEDAAGLFDHRNQRIYFRSNFFYADRGQRTWKVRSLETNSRNATTLFRLLLYFPRVCEPRRFMDTWMAPGSSRFSTFNGIST